MLPTEKCAPGQSPSTNRVPSSRNTTMVATLIDANQNSVSPNERADARFVAVSSSISPSEKTHCGTPGIQPWRIFAPATASNATTPTQKYQYSQPMVKPAQPPSESRAYSMNEPSAGAAGPISPSIRMTSTTSSPPTA